MYYFYALSNNFIFVLLLKYNKFISPVYVVDCWRLIPGHGVLNKIAINCLPQRIPVRNYNLMCLYPTKLTNLLHCVPKKHVTTFLMISWSRTVRLERSLAHLLLRVQAIDRCFIFPPHLFRVATLPWEIVKT